ncbi:MAG: hypothetical protein E7040_06675 [Lentisphaerae bacterium]|nr:hypothetical protein [Lentisphaerota bacterium]
MNAVRRTLFLILPVAACVILCSCATALTVENLGRESFRWSPKDMQVTIRTTTDKSFLEHQTVCITKKGTLKEFRVPYDFDQKYPFVSKITRTKEYPVKGNLPVFAVKVKANAVPVMTRHKDGFLITNDSKLNWSYVGMAESVKPYDVTSEDFQSLQKPFWFCRGKNEWFLCVPLQPIRIDDYYQISTMIIHPGGERYLSPEETRNEERYWSGIGINCARFACSIIPLAFDIATFPVQLIVFMMI